MFRYQQWYNFLIIYVLFGFFVILTWQKWGFVTGDLGRELYAPLRILNGQVPYRDFVWIYGPLSIYLTTIFYLIFGIHSDTYLILTLLIGIGILFLNIRISKKLFNNNFLVISSSIFILILSYFGFTYQSLLMTGKLSSALGALFWFSGLYAIVFYKKKISETFLVLLLGLSLVTKIEFFMALALMIIVFLWQQKFSTKKIIKLLLSGSILGISPYLWFLSQGLSVKLLLENIFPQAGAIWATLNFQSVLESLTQTLLETFLLFLVIETWSLSLTKKAKVVSLFIFILIIISLKSKLLGIITGLPDLLGWVLVLVVLVNIPKLRREKIALITLISLVPLLGRNYGLASGYLDALIVIPFFLIIFKIERFQKTKLVVIILLLCIYFGLVYRIDYSQKTVRVNTQTTSLDVSSNDGRVIQETNFYLNQFPNSQVLAIPDEEIINFAGNRINPTKSDQWLIGYPTLAQKIGQNYQDFPKTVLISNYNFFNTTGKGDTALVLATIRNSYRLTKTIGPYKGSNYQIQIWQKND